MKATVQVFLKPGVLDVQGKAVESALHGLGWDGVKDVRVGKTLTFEDQTNGSVTTPLTVTSLKATP